MAKPTPDEMHIAAQWLDINEGAEDAVACRRVREWLLQQAEAAEFRAACREAGVPVSHAKKAAMAAGIIKT